MRNSPLFFLILSQSFLFLIPSLLVVAKKMDGRSCFLHHQNPYQKAVTPLGSLVWTSDQKYPHQSNRWRRCKNVSDRDHRRTHPFGFRALSMGTGSDDVNVITPSSSIVGTIVFLLPSMTGGDESNHNRPSRFGSSSPFGRNATLIESAFQLVRKTRFFSDGRVNARCVSLI